MKITKKEVKTIYEIEISFKDYCKIRTNAKTDVIAEVMKAFENVNLDDTTMGTLKFDFEKLDDVNTLKYIVRKLGFDGVENYGYHKEKFEGSGVHSMVVYNCGDDINN